MTTSSSSIEQLTPDDAARRVADGAVLLDVRTPEEFAAGHAPSAVALPVAELVARLGELDPAVPIIAMCRVGGRSQAAAELLASAGFEVANAAGGMQAWATAGRDVVTADGTPGAIV